MEVYSGSTHPGRQRYRCRYVYCWSYSLDSSRDSYLQCDHHPSQDGLLTIYCVMVYHSFPHSFSLQKAITRQRPKGGSPTAPEGGVQKGSSASAKAEEDDDAPAQV